MKPSLLTGLLGLALIPLCFMEPTLSFLPSESMESFGDSAGSQAVYMWTGSYFGQLPAIEQEMQEHGYFAHICLDPENCVAIFTREDGNKVTLSRGGWKGGPKWAPEREYIVASIEDSRSAQKFLSRLLARCGLHGPCRPSP